MSVYTKGGDLGKTDLYGKQRVYKDHLKVSAYGNVDELNAALGLARGELIEDEKNKIYWIQQKLIVVCTELAATQATKDKMTDKISNEDTAILEYWIDHMDGVLPDLTEWIIPGDNSGSAKLHFARTVARRVERNMVSLHRDEEQREELLKFINRISDFLFQLARKLDLDDQVNKIKSVVMDQIAGNDVIGLAEKIAKAAHLKSIELNVPVTVAIVDKAGYLVMLKKFDNCLLGSVEIAQTKAKTSILLNMSTETLGTLSKPGQPLFGIESSNGGLISFGGGVPIMINDQIWGGLGISGGTVEEDIVIANAGLRVLEEA